MPIELIEDAPMELAVQGSPAFGLEEITKTAAALAELRKRLKGIAYAGLETLAGMQSALDDRRELRDLRVKLGKMADDMNKRDRADTKVRCDARRTEAERITNEILLLEKPIDQQIKVEEERKERVRLEKLAAENKRKAAHAEAIAKIRSLVGRAQGRKATEIAAALAVVRAYTPTQVEEFGDEYELAKVETTGALQALYETTLKAEELAAENARMAAELAARKAELDRQQDELKLQASEQAAREAKIKEAEAAQAVDAASDQQASIPAITPAATQEVVPAAPAVSTASNIAAAASAPPQRITNAISMGAQFGIANTRGYLFTASQLADLIDFIKESK